MVTLPRMGGMIGLSCPGSSFDFRARTQSIESRVFDVLKRSG